jgi:hypothetical protein
MSKFLDDVKDLNLSKELIDRIDKEILKDDGGETLAGWKTLKKEYYKKLYGGSEVPRSFDEYGKEVSERKVEKLRRELEEKGELEKIKSMFGDSIDKLHLEKLRKEKKEYGWGLGEPYIPKEYKKYPEGGTVDIDYSEIEEKVLREAISERARKEAEKAARKTDADLYDMFRLSETTILICCNGKWAVYDKNMLKLAGYFKESYSSASGVIHAKITKIINKLKEMTKSFPDANLDKFLNAHAEITIKGNRLKYEEVIPGSTGGWADRIRVYEHELTLEGMFIMYQSDECFNRCLELYKSLGFPPEIVSYAGHYIK